MKTYEFNPALDQDYMAMNYATDLGFCKALLEMFQQNVPLDVSQIKEAILLKDFDKVSSLAHKIKPSFKMVGLSQLSEGLVEVEMKAKSDGESAILIFEKLLPKIEEGFIVIDDEIGKLTKCLEVR